MLSFIENCGKSTLKRRIWVFSGRTCWQSLQFGTNNCWKLSKSELYKQISSIIFHLPLEDMSAMSAESRRLAVVTRPTFRQKSTFQSHINCSQTPHLQTSTPATNVKPTSKYSAKISQNFSHAENGAAIFNAIPIWSGIH